MTSSPDWSVIPQVLVKRERWSAGYKALVRPGQEVLPDQPVLQLEATEQTGSGQSLSAITNRMNGRVTREGDVSRGTMIPSGLHGRVVEITRRGGVVIESRAVVIQGAIGAGGPVAGILTLWQPGSTQRIPSGAILVVPGPLSFAMLYQAMSSGVAGLIASSIAARDLEGFLHTDLIQLIDSDDVERAQRHLPAMTVLLTEGLGSFAMSTSMIDVLGQYQGAVVLLSGATSVRRRIFPELVISFPIQETEQNRQPIQPDLMLTLGTRVRVCCGERTGTIGIIDYLFMQPLVFPSGIRANAVRLLLEDGSLLVVPDTMVKRPG